MPAQAGISLKKSENRHLYINLHTSPVTSGDFLYMFILGLDSEEEFNMKKGYFSVGTAALLSLGLFTNSFAVDACNDAMGHVGTEHKVQVSPSGQNNQYQGLGKISGTAWGFEEWYESGNNSMSYWDNGTFKASWSGTNDYLARVGFQYNGGIDHSTKHFAVDYKYTKSGTAQYGYIGVYGWTTNPQVEYYIVDDWYSQPSETYIGEKFGEITVDGANYTIHAFLRVNQPSKTGNSTFLQIFSVRSTARQCGHIDISAHFNKWTEIFTGQKKNLRATSCQQGQACENYTLKFGSITEVMLMNEAGGNASGSVDYTYFDMTDNGTPSEPPTPIERKPFGGTATLLPGTVEAENFDEGDYGVSYSGTQGASGETGDHEYRGSDYSSVDIVSGGSGRAIGYTAKGEWLEYTINVDADGEYDIEANVSNGSGSGTVQLSLDGADLASLPFNGTSDWDAYELATGKATLTKGQHTLRITIANDNTNVDYVKFTLPGYTPSSSSSGEPAAIAQDIRMNGVFKSLQVFDMQGRNLGRVSVAAGASIQEALFAKFHKAGIYLVKQGSQVMRARVTR